MKLPNFSHFTEENMEHTKTFTILSWVLRGIAAVILLQTLFFKFSGAKESVYIFTAVGMEPWGRIGSGVVELIASILLLVPRTVVYGAGISLVVISGAIFFHLTKLGIALPAVDDKGELFTLAVVVFVCSAGVLILHRNELPVFTWVSPSLQ
jgi:putative oxidoreductase